MPTVTDEFFYLTGDLSAKQSADAVQRLTAFSLGLPPKHSHYRDRDAGISLAVSIPPHTHTHTKTLLPGVSWKTPSFTCAVFCSWSADVGHTWELSSLESIVPLLDSSESEPPTAAAQDRGHSFVLYVLNELMCSWRVGRSLQCA